jgi:uncharacterized protein
VKTLRSQFGLVLMVNHACNLRCTYCYTGAKFSSPMPWEIGVAAIQRGFASLMEGGQLELGFFGGEPLLEAAQLQKWMRFARDAASSSAKHVKFNLTTNGTIQTPAAWSVMNDNALDLAVSFDGTPALQDRHRRDAHGHGSARVVEHTIRRLIKAKNSFSVVAVVRPDNLAKMLAGLEYLYQLGVRHIHLSLDLWTSWLAADICRLEEFINGAANLWRRWLPDFSLNWFDAKAAGLAHLPIAEPSTRCGYGDGEIAVAPSGRLYPCERLIGEDRPEQPARLPGHILEGEDFLKDSGLPFSRPAPCSSCALAFACDTDCRCSNFIRTGSAEHPDGLLCRLNKATARATARNLRETFMEIASQ